MKFARNLLLTSVFLAFAASGALAGDIKISAAWSRATVRGASVGVGYFLIENKGKEADRLLAAASDLAERTEVHESKIEDGVMKMRTVPEGVEIKPGASVAFKPGSYHLMLVGLKEALFPGMNARVTLTFAKAGAVPVELKVEPFGAQGPKSDESKSDESKSDENKVEAPKVTAPKTPAPVKEEPPQISY